MDDERYMRRALALAQQAAEEDETPIGAVVVYKDQIIGEGYNKRNQKGNPLCHAEIEAIHQAAVYLGDWRLEECSMYITLEPCPMCAGAIVQARIPRVVLGAMNPKAGCAGSIMNLLEETKFNHQVQVVRGLLEEESRELMQRFFADLRKRKE
ncbi:MAG: nucleoside deaminase [Lachnospiraceae bacterium]|nr:nucleoside deaminase [Lachnospiraceae bacterium]